MSIKGVLMSGVIALLAIGIPFWYCYTVLYPQYQDNLLYLGIGGLILVLFASFAVNFAKKRGSW